MKYPTHVLKMLNGLSAEQRAHQRIYIVVADILQQLAGYVLLALAVWFGISFVSHDFAITALGFSAHFILDALRIDMGSILGLVMYLTVTIASFVLGIYTIKVD